MVQRPPGYRVVVRLRPSQQSGWQRRKVYHKTFWTTTMATSCHQMVYAGCQCCPVFCWLVLTLGACMCGGVTCRGEPKLSSFIHKWVTCPQVFWAYNQLAFYITFTNVVYVAEIIICRPCLGIQIFTVLNNWPGGYSIIGCHSWLIKFLADYGWYYGAKLLSLMKREYKSSIFARFIFHLHPQCTGCKLWMV